MDQKTYSCVLRFRGELLHSVPLSCVTKHELQLLAFMHGAEAIAELKFIKSQPVFHPANEAGEAEIVKSEMDEFKRLARKYDTLVNSGRGKKAVEECFRTRIEDFDAIVAEVDARDAMAKAAEEAEAQAAVTDAAKNREKPEDVAHTQTAKPPMGSRVFGAQPPAG